MVSLPVCVSVGHICELCKNGSTDLDAIWGGGLTWVTLSNHVLDGGQDTPWEVAMFGVCPTHSEALADKESFSCQ